MTNKFILLTILVSLASVFNPAQAQDGAFHQPAHFQISAEVLQPNPGPFAAVTEGIPGNRMFSFDVEPFPFRPMFQAGQDAKNRIYPADPNDLTLRDFRGPDMWQGAGVRVYRILNGKLTLVRSDNVSEFVSEEKEFSRNLSSSEVIEPTRQNFSLFRNGFARNGLDVYYTLVAVDAQGQESVPSEAVKIFHPKDIKTSTQREKEGMIRPRIKAPRRGQDFANPVPQPPTNLQGRINAQSGKLEFTWDPSPTPGLIGYRLFESYVAPSEMRGVYLTLASAPDRPEQSIKKGDLIFLDQLIREWTPDLTSNRMANFRKTQPEIYPVNGEDGVEWRIEPLPVNAPSELHAYSRNWLKINLQSGNRIEMSKNSYKSPTNRISEAHVFEQGATYVAEFWARQEGMSSPEITLDFPGPLEQALGVHHVQIGSTLEKHQIEFTPSAAYTGKHIGKTRLRFRGPGTLWFDALRIYKKESPYMALLPEDAAMFRDAALGHLRTHHLIKTKSGYYLPGLLHGIGAFDSSGGGGFATAKEQNIETLPYLLNLMKDFGINPWIQLEMSLDESEWAGFVEYMAAPFNPATDNAKDKPWAALRHSQGQTRPWIEEFEDVIFEISNEVWNPLFAPYVFVHSSQMTDAATGKIYKYGELYGIMQEYVISQLKQSPYWTPEMDRKFRFALGGHAAEISRNPTNNFTIQAARFSPNSDLLTVAAYNGGWEEKTIPLSPNPKGYFQALTSHIGTIKQRFTPFIAQLGKEGLSHK